MNAVQNEAAEAVATASEQDIPIIAYDSETGEEVDMRSPQVKLAACEAEYADLLACGEHEAAVRVLVARRALVRMAYGDEHVRYVRASVTLAKAYLELMQRPEAAFEMAKTSQSAFRAYVRSGRDRLYPDDSALLEADLFTTMGEALLALKEPAEADKVLKRAHVALFERATTRARDADPMLLGRALEASALAAFRLGRLEEAASGLERAVASEESAGGPEAGHLIVLRRHQAEVESARGKHAAAARLHTQALKHTERIFGAASIAAWRCRLSLAKAHAADGDEERATADLQTLLSQVEAVCDAHDELTMAVRNSLTKLLMRREHYDDAVLLLQRTLALHEMAEGEMSLGAGETHKTLASVRLAQGRPKAALRHFAAAMNAFKVVRGPKHSSVRKIQDLIKAIKMPEDTKEKRRPVFHVASRSTKLSDLPGRG